MKGVVFNILEEMVVEKGGVPLWETLLNRAGFEGAYAAPLSYDDVELFTLVTEIQKELNIPLEDLLHAFGDFMFTKLNERYPKFTEREPELFGFLKSIEPVIHLEVRKMYDEPNLPSIECAAEEDTLVMQYSSPRKLCILAEGLVQGASAHYKTPINITHDVCMHKGSDYCELVIKK